MRYKFEILFFFFLVFCCFLLVFLINNANLKLELLVLEQAKQIEVLKESVSSLNQNLISLQVKYDHLLLAKEVEIPKIALESSRITLETSSSSISYNKILLGVFCASVLGGYGYYNFSALSSAAVEITYLFIDPLTIAWLLESANVSSKTCALYFSLPRSQAEIDALNAHIESMFD
jgi:hypothetical protein